MKRSKPSCATIVIRLRRAILLIALLGDPSICFAEGAGGELPRKAGDTLIDSVVLLIRFLHKGSLSSPTDFQKRASVKFGTTMTVRGLWALDSRTSADSSESSRMFSVNCGCQPSTETVVRMVVQLANSNVSCRVRDRKRDFYTRESRRLQGEFKWLASHVLRVADSSGSKTMVGCSKRTCSNASGNSSFARIVTAMSW